MSGTIAEANPIEKNNSAKGAVTVEEAVTTLEFTEAMTVTSPSSAPSSKTNTKNSTELTHRELPIFSNPLLANATQANSVPIKPKTGRVKSGGKTVPVLRISAPKVDGEVVVMRRMDTDLVNATSMFNAAYPAISEKMNAKESSYITRKYDGRVEKSGALTGVWITLSQGKDTKVTRHWVGTKELAKEYEIDQFMRPLLEASNVKNGSPVEGEEVVEKMVISEVTAVQTVAQTERQDIEIDESQAVEETTEKLQDLTVDDVAKMKRRIEELEDQVSRDKKKLRGLATVAVGLAAATVIPQVLPFFS
ncbi:hypothetical protein BGX21_000005 [Mortierella sp. AD011]|nr:hypothetical protein BGX20_008213 [Mortierella sp. AD010]KAF9404059.1 hypothetical protein BGX21_000005 [Mortierella sp. AD011]